MANANSNLRQIHLLVKKKKALRKESVREKREAEGLKIMTKCVVQAYIQHELVILVAKLYQLIVLCVSNIC